MAYTTKVFNKDDALLASDMNNIIEGIDECKDGFVAKTIFSTDTPVQGSDAGYVGRVYVVDFNGNQTSIPARTQAGNWTIACRDYSGNMQVANPTLPYHCATKKYVDDLIAAFTYELVEEITVTEAGNVDKSTTPSGKSYIDLYKNMLVTITNAENKGSAYCYIYRDNELCKLASEAAAGEFLTVKTEKLANGLAEWSVSKVAATGYGSNNVNGYLEASSNVSRILVANCEVGTVIKIYGMKA
jgi:hypothetical protein